MIFLIISNHYYLTILLSTTLLIVVVHQLWPLFIIFRFTIKYLNQTKLVVLFIKSYTGDERNNEPSTARVPSTSKSTSTVNTATVQATATDQSNGIQLDHPKKLSKYFFKRNWEVFQSLLISWKVFRVTLTIKNLTGGIRK